MDKIDEKIFIRIAEALERLSPPIETFGNLDDASSYLWKTSPDRLIPVKKKSHITMDLLVGIDGLKNQILRNTVQFAKGFSANNVLLWGARGTGKSSLVKSVHKMVSAEFTSLKLVEIQKDNLDSLDRLLFLLSNLDIRYRYIIFCDDLSFSEENNEYKTLKILLEGGVLEKPENLLFYSTSNRKHLIARKMIENEQSTEISPSESIEEKVSLSDRFGLVLGFYPCSQESYLEMILIYKNAFDIPLAKEDLFRDAIEWQQTRGGRSGRIAWQYIVDLAGRLEVPLVKDK